MGHAPPDTANHRLAPMRSWAGLVAMLVLMGPPPSAAHGQQAPKPSNSSSPALKTVRWQYLDRKFQNVFIDGHGQAWYLVREYPANQGGVRPPSMILTCPESPNDFIEIPGTNGIIGFDSKNRFWDVGPYGLCCTQIGSGKFTQLKPAPGVDLSPWPANWGQWKPAFGATMLEHSSGRMYFVDSVGVHVFDGETWQYELLLPPGKNWGGSQIEHYHCSVKMSEGPDGRVFVWQPGSYVNTLFVHDGKSWKRFPAAAYPELDGPAKIVPQDGGWVRVDRDYGASTRVKLYEPDPGEKTLAAASRPATRVESDYLVRAGEELSLYGNPICRDQLGRVYFHAAGQEIFDGYSRLAVLDPRVAAGDPTVKYQAFALHRTTDMRAIAMDSQGGVWARLALDEHPFLSRFADGKWTHFADPTGPVTEHTRASMAQYGMHWVIRPPDAKPNWQPDWRKDSSGLPAMTNSALLQALKNGAMIASEDFNQRAFLYDGKQWQVYASLKVLVESQYEFLKANVENQAMSWRRDTFIGRDGTGRVWAAAGRDDHAFHGAYDGKQWQETAQGAFEFSPDGTRCLSGGRLLDTSVNPPRELASAKSRPYRPMFACLRIDTHGSYAPFDPFVAGSYAAGSAKWERAVDSISTPPDASGIGWVGGTYLGDPAASYHLQAVWPDGMRSQPYRHPYRMNPNVVHQGGNVYWAAASDGLLRLRLTGQGDKARVMVDRQYRQIIPQGAVVWIALGNDGALWMATEFGHSGLYRIEIPAIEEGAK